MYNKISKVKHWRGLSGLGLIFVLLLINFTDTAWNSGAAGAATDAYYTLKPGETLDEVARHFELATRTLRCANPGYRTGDKRIILPLTSARRHQVQPGETLGKIADMYEVEPSVITQFPLNYWQGCSGAAGLGSERVEAQPPAGIILYVPEIKPLRMFNSRNSLLNLPVRNTPSAANGVAPVAVSPITTNSPPPTSALASPSPIATATPTPATNTSSIAVTPIPTATPVATATPVSQPPIQAPAPKPGPLIWPIRGIITTHFSLVTHPGIDIATGANTPILAAQSGLVYFCSWSPYGYGNFVQIEHGDGRQTHYAHLSRFAVKYGDFVKQGQVIGYEGSTGNSTGPHLHFELVLDGNLVDPLQYLPDK